MCKKNLTESRHPRNENFFLQRSLLAIYSNVTSAVEDWNSIKDAPHHLERFDSAGRSRKAAIWTRQAFKMIQAGNTLSGVLSKSIRAAFCVLQVRAADFHMSFAQMSKLVGSSASTWLAQRDSRSFSRKASSLWKN